MEHQAEQGRQVGTFWFSHVLATAFSTLLLWAIIIHSGFAREVELRGGTHGPHSRTVLRVWDWWSPGTDERYGTYFAAVKREFEQIHPDVEVLFQYIPFSEYEQKMATGLVGNSPPDVFQSSVYWAEGFYDRGMLLPLNGFMERDRIERKRRQAAGLPVDMGDSVDREAFLEAAWRHNTKPDGTVFGIPQILDSDCLVWNLDILRKAAQSDAEIRGMFLQKADGTSDYSRLRFDALHDWEQFRRVVRKLTRYDAQGKLLLDGNGEFVQAGFALHAHGSGAEPFLPWFAANGSNFQDAVGTRALFANPAGVEAAQFLLDLYWKDHVSPAFRRQLSDDEVFNAGKVACIMTGTWAGKYIVRNTEGKLRFDLTPFPPGPHGHGQSTLTWGNMLVVSRRAAHPDLAWEYIKFITSKSGALRILKLLDWNSGRKDFYDAPDWQQVCRDKPYQSNVPAIAACGKKLRHTQINAANYASESTFETLLLHYPEIEAGHGSIPSVKAGLETAAQAVDRVYDRYNAQVADWRAGREGAR
jgi:ABC-type glycerol-3-phosphate transport system substrate-binding protein